MTVTFPKDPPESLVAREFHFPKAQTSVLGNGMCVTVVERQGLPLIGIKLGILSGLTEEEQEMPGTTAVAADMLRKGTESRSAEEIAEQIDFLGTEIRASGGKDYLMLSAAVLSEFAGDALDLIADMTINPVFPKKELAKVVRLELSSLANKRTQPTYQATKVYSKVLYGDHPYGAFDTDEKVLKGLSNGNLKGFHFRRFRPEKTHLVSVGEIDLDAAKDLIEEKFGRWSAVAGTADFSPDLTMETRRRVCIVDNPNAVQSNIFIGNLAIPYGHPDYVRFLVANQVLGGSYASRLFMNLREQKSFTYGAYSKVDARVKGGTLIAYAAVRNEVTDAAISEFLWEFVRMREEPVVGEELQAAKDYLTGSFPLELERSLNVADHIMLQKIHGLGDYYWDTFRARVDEVTTDEVMETAKKYIHPDDAMICVVGKGDELMAVLEKYGQPEVYDKTGNPVAK